ncbi:MAG: VWA domain-containing protein [Phycisphaerae bacterium]
MLLAVTWHDRFDEPRALWLLLLPVVLWLWSRRSLAGLSPGRRMAALVARTLVIALLVLALAGLQNVRISRDLSVIFVLDQSRSVPAEKQEDARRLARATTQKPPANDRVGVITFDGEAYIDQLPNKPGPDGGIYSDVRMISPANQPDRTNIAAAIRLALACFPADTAKRIVLVSDGNQNAGDAAVEVQTAAANNVSIDVVPVRYDYDSEVMFERLVAPAYAREQENAPLRLTLRSRRATRGKVQLYHDGRLVNLSNVPGAGVPVDLQPGLNTFGVRLPLNHAGAHRFEARFVPDDPATDRIAANNAATAFTNVEGPAKALLISANPGDDQPLVEALAKEKILLDVRTAAEAELDPIALQQYAAVLLANVPADQFNETQHRSLASYVRDLGGGLIMLGGNDGFGAGGWQSSLVEAIMPVRFDVDAIRQIPRGALAIVMHACEMPQGNYWGVETAIAAMKTLSSLDYFGVVAWTFGGLGWGVPMRLCDDKPGIANQIRRMGHGDAPDFDSLMQLAYDGLRGRRDAAQRHMIVISDGDPAPPSAKLISSLRRDKITVTAISVFPHGGMQIGTMKKMAQDTGGNYYDLSRSGDERLLPQIFIKEAKIVRRPLLREETFTPKVRYHASDLLAGIRELPPLRGYVVTTPRSQSQIELPLVSDKGDPILANWQCGLGRTVAFTSGWWNYWGPDWIGWSGFSKIFAQSVRWCMSQGSAKDFEVSTFIDGGRGRVVVEALNKDADYLNFLQMQGIVLTPGGATSPIRLDQTGPGRYEGQFSVADGGNYLLNIQASGGGQPAALIRTGVSLAYSPEYRDQSADEAALQKIADATHGRWLDLPADQIDLFAKNLPAVLARQPLWSLLLRAAVICFLLDVAVRRVAIDPRQWLARARAYVAEMAGRLIPVRRAEVVLTDLKSVRDKVRADKTAAGSGERVRSVPSPVATRKFEAPADARPTGDLTQALGGATASDKPAAAAKPKPGDAPAEETTARLLKVKRRRQDGDPPPG